MEISKVTPKEYAAIINEPFHVFGSADFNWINRSRCDNLYYLLFRENKYRLGIICGADQNRLRSPFSAPFGGFSYISKNIRLSHVEMAIMELENWSKKEGFSIIDITLPPPIYNNSFISKQVNTLWRMGFEMTNIDLNFSFDLKKFGEHYREHIWRNARKNLRIALESDLHFQICDTEDGKKEVYDVISRNRKERGFPLRMSWGHVDHTIAVVGADFFMVKDGKGDSVASAIVFHITSEIVQIIYWGEIHDYSGAKPMNFLSFKVFEYYTEKGIQRIDIGPSTDNSIPNYGLVEFKESIGCTVELKYSFSKQLN